MISWVPPPATALVLGCPPSDEAATEVTAGHAALRSAMPIRMGRTARVGSRPIVLRLLRVRLFRRSTLRGLGPVQGERHASEAGGCHPREQERAGERFWALRSDLEGGRAFGDVPGRIDGSETDRMGSTGEVERQGSRRTERRKGPAVDAHLESRDPRTTIRRAPSDRYVAGGDGARRIEAGDVRRYGIHADGNGVDRLDMSSPVRREVFEKPLSVGEVQRRRIGLPRTAVQSVLEGRDPAAFVRGSKGRRDRTPEPTILAAGSREGRGRDRRSPLVFPGDDPGRFRAVSAIVV